MIRRAFIAALILLPLALGLAAWLLLPGWIGKRVESAIGRAGQALDLRIDHQRFTLEGTERLVLEGVVVTPSDALPTEGPLFEAPRVVVTASVVSWWPVKVRLGRIDIQQGQVFVSRRADGTDNFGPLLARVRRMLGPSKPGGTGRRSRLWDHLEKRVPDVVLAQSTIDVSDRSSDRSLLPAPLPDRLSFPNLEVELVNEASLVGQVDLRLSTSCDLPWIDSRVRLSASFDGGTGQRSADVRLVKPARVPLNDRTVTLQGASWLLGDSVRLTGLTVGEELRADSITVRLRPLQEMRGNPLDWVERVEIEAPEVSGGLFDPARLAGMAPPAEASPTESTRIRPPTADGDRPRKQKTGAAVRTAMIAAFLHAGDRVKRAAGAIQRLGGRFPLPELVVRAGKVRYPDDEALSAALARFDLTLRRVGAGLLESRLVLHSDGDEQAEAPPSLTTRVQLDTGDVQVTLEAGRLPLYPWRALVPSRVLVNEATVLRDTDLKLIYGAEASHLEVRGKFAVEHVGLDLPPVAREPLEELSLGGDLSAALDLGAARIEVSESTFRLGEVDVRVALEADDLEDAPLLKWSIVVPRVPAIRVVDALPDAFLGRLKGLELSGDIGWTVKGSLDTRDMSSLDYEARPRAWDFQVKRLGDGISFSRLRKRFRHKVPGRGGSKKAFWTGPGSSRWVPLEEVSPWMAKVLTTTEDGTFWKHRGLAFFQIRDAIIDNLEKGEFYRGASTITQQLVKNVFLEREKTLARKAQEMFLSWRLDRYLDKDEILALYLNVIELGPDVYGIGKAADYYFEKTPADLNLIECVFLASILPNPRKFHYLFRRGEVTESWRKGLERIVKVMHKRKKVTTAQMRAAAPYSPYFRPR